MPFNVAAPDYGKSFNDAFTGMGNFMLGKQKQEEDLKQRGIENVRADAAEVRAEKQLGSSLETDKLNQERLRAENEDTAQKSLWYKSTAEKEEQTRDIQILTDYASQNADKPDAPIPPHVVDAYRRVTLHSPLINSDPSKRDETIKEGQTFYDGARALGSLNTNGIAKTYDVLPGQSPQGDQILAATGGVKARIVTSPNQGEGSIVVTKKDKDGNLVEHKPVTFQDIHNKSAAAINGNLLIKKIEGRMPTELVTDLYKERLNGEKALQLISDIDKLKTPPSKDASGKTVSSHSTEFNDKIDFIKNYVKSGGKVDAVATLYNSLITEKAAKTETEDGARTAISMFMKSGIKGNDKYIQSLKKDFNEDGSPKVNGSFKTSKDAKDVIAKIMELNATNWRNEQDNLAKERAFGSKEDPIRKAENARLKQYEMDYARAERTKTDETGKPLNQAGIDAIKARYLNFDSQLKAKYGEGHLSVSGAIPQSKELPLGAAIEWVKSKKQEDSKRFIPKGSKSVTGSKKSSSGIPIIQDVANFTKVGIRQDEDYKKALIEKGYLPEQAQRVIDLANGKVDQQQYVSQQPASVPMVSQKPEPDRATRDFLIRKYGSKEAAMKAWEMM